MVWLTGRWVAVTLVVFVSADGTMAEPDGEEGELLDVTGEAVALHPAAEVWVPPEAGAEVTATPDDGRVASPLTLPAVGVSVSSVLPADAVTAPSAVDTSVLVSVDVVEVVGFWLCQPDVIQGDVRAVAVSCISPELELQETD